MKKRKPIHVDAEQARNFWSTAPSFNSKAQEQLAIPEPEIKEKKPAKQEAGAYEREIIIPEDALEQFVQSLCFAEYLFQAYDNDMILELHPYRKPSGWLWDCRMTPNPTLPYRTINLEMPKISEELYREMYDRFYTEEHSLLWVYTQIGNAYKQHPALNPYAKILREDLKNYLIDLEITA